VCERDTRIRRAKAKRAWGRALPTRENFPADGVIRLSDKSAAATGWKPPVSCIFSDPGTSPNRHHRQNPSSGDDLTPKCPRCDRHRRRHRGSNPRLMVAHPRRAGSLQPRTSWCPGSLLIPLERRPKNTDLKHSATRLSLRLDSGILKVNTGS
jgi:hypothetical protein